MSRTTASRQPRPLIGLIAGIGAGLVAAGVMAAFQAAAAPVAGADKGDDDPATVKAADRVSVAVMGETLPDAYREPAGKIVHYLTGAALGGLYGVITEYRPAASAGFGGTFGIATSLVLDEAAVPAAGLGNAPQETPLATHLYGIASHVVYGVVLEGMREVLGGRR